MTISSQRGWRRGNLLLFIAILVVNTYIISLPFLPNLVYSWQHTDQASQPKTVAEVVKQSAAQPHAPGVFYADATHDGLIIPRMDLNTPLVEGPMSNSFNLLNKGAWRLPISSTPDEGGNTVIAGHRFSYTGPRGIFYFLNKLVQGDQIGLWYQGKLYTYVVESSTTHDATDVYVQEPTRDTRLTIYTCTPLWNPTSRLVIVAKPIAENTP